MKRPTCSPPTRWAAPTVGVSEGGPCCQTKTKWCFSTKHKCRWCCPAGAPAARWAASSPDHVTPADMTDRSQTRGRRLTEQTYKFAHLVWRDLFSHNPALVLFRFSSFMYLATLSLCDISHFIQFMLHKPPSCLRRHWEKGFGQPRKSERQIWWVLSGAASPGSSVELRGMLQEAPSSKNSLQLLSLTVLCISSL